MRTWNISIELKVSDNWIADGFDASERHDEINEMFQSMLPYAHYGTEVQTKIKITKAPAKEVIRGLQDGTIEIK